MSHRLTRLPNAFPRENVAHGDGRVMAYVIRCSSCPAEEYARFATADSTYMDPERLKVVFRKKGWTVDKKRSADVCPRCNGSCKPRNRQDGDVEVHKRNDMAPRRNQTAAVADYARRRMPEPSPINDQEKTVVDTASSEAVTDKPAAVQLSVDSDADTPTRQDRRLIHEALTSAYYPEKGFYRGENTDASVAKRLGLPRVWVAMVREDFFGPDKSEADKALRETARSMLGEIERIDGELLALMEATARLRAELGKLTGGDE